ncbi:MAG: hypothetical protein ACRBF0_01635 [Calditrichia bacterium]
MKNFIVPGIAAGVALFIWAAVSWMVIPWHNATINNMPNGEEIAALMKENLTEHQVYHYPGFPLEQSDSEMEAMFNKMKQGPNMHFMVYNPNGVDPMSPMSFLAALIMNILTGIAAAWLLLMALPKLNGTMEKVLFMLTVGTIAMLVGPLANWNWWHFPADFTLVMIADMAVSWVIVGLILAKMVKPT